MCYTFIVNKRTRRKSMKKLSILALVAIALSACGESKPTPEDFKAVEAELQNIAENGGVLAISAIGTAGDYIIPIPETETIAAIAAKKKTVTFLSVENPAEHVAEGQCMLNIIPTNTMQAMNMPENKCNFRLFCGSAEDLAEEVYAVELCSE